MAFHDRQIRIIKTCLREKERHGSDQYATKARNRHVCILTKLFGIGNTSFDILHFTHLLALFEV